MQAKKRRPDMSGDLYRAVADVRLRKTLLGGSRQGLRAQTQRQSWRAARCTVARCTALKQVQQRWPSAQHRLPSSDFTLLRRCMRN